MLPPVENWPDAEFQEVTRTAQAANAPKRMWRNDLERVVQTEICHINFFIREVAEEFKLQPHHGTIKYYYPAAEGGPVYVDTPGSAEEIKACERKRPIMKKLGKRYAIVPMERDGKMMSAVDIAKQLEG